MTPDRWQQVKDIFSAASSLADADRRAYVDEACRGDAVLLEEIDSLLVAHANENAIVDRPAVLHVAGELAEVPPDPWIGRRIGAYKILSEIGRGGMGTAYLAARADEAFDKRVAVKLIKRGMDSDAILRKFRHERQILANLEHPNIVRLLDGGSTDDGLPYFIMEYVDGVPIDEYCESKGLDVPERLKLFQAVCAAVHHAHGQRIVHRDLKPSNTLVTASGVPKLLDFGIAKLLDTTGDFYTREPTALARAMTPEYSSPEQIRGEPLTPLSDVYSLGVLLYELIAGRHPYALDGRSLKDVERIVCEELPSPPSTVSGANESRARGKRRSLRRRLAGDLDTIALKALSKSPSARYASAQAFADDIQRHLDGVSIVARRPWFRFRSARLQRGLAAAAVVAVAAIVLAAAGRFMTPRGPAVETQSVAVLPFANVGDDPELEYLSEGLTEDIINRLSRVPELKVIARNSAFQYKGLAIDPEQVGRELGVRSILTGRVVQRGTNLSVMAELVDTRDRRQIWGERYERTMGGVQGLQSELAQQIATNLRLTFPGSDEAVIGRTYTHNLAAYEAYLKGRYFWNKRTVPAFRTSIDYFTQAVEKDPEFALAYVGLADAYSLLTEYHAVPAAETYAQAKSAVLKALEIDPDLPEARVSLAYINQFYEWNFEAAEREYRTVLERNPNYATGHQWYAEYLAAMGRHDEAIAEIRKALAVDPLSLIVNAVEANILYMAGEYDQAIAQAREVVALDPNFPEVYEYLKRSHDQKGQYRESIDARQMRRRLIGLDPRESPALAEAAATTDARVYWQKRLEQELVESETEGFQAYEFAEIYAQAGDTPRALEWLERACNEPDFMMMYVRVAPNLAPLRDELKYREIVSNGCAVAAR